MIIVAGTARIPTENMGAYNRMAATMIAATRAEAGCRTYSFAEDVLEPGLVRIFEIWESRAHLDAHLKAPHMGPWRQGLAEIGAYDRDIRTYESDGGAPL